MIFTLRIAATLVTASLAMAVVSCEPSNKLRSFETSVPELSYMSSYTGKLSQRDDCVILVLGEQIFSRGNPDLQDNEVGIPLFNRGFRIEATADSYLITTPTGLSFPEGTIVTGEGGPYPEKPLDPRSAPVGDPPDTSQCPGTPFQINSMYISELKNFR